MRTGKHEHFLEFSKHLEIPIINGLTQKSSPLSGDGGRTYC